MTVWPSGDERPKLHGQAGLDRVERNFHHAPEHREPLVELDDGHRVGRFGARPRGGMRITVNEVILPGPRQGHGRPARRWHAGQNSLGGTASAPHDPQRMAVSRPSRASSKKLCSVITRSVTAEQADEDGGRVPAECVNESRARAVDLPRARVAAQLGHDLADLRGARRADGMPLRLEPARRIDRDLAAETGPALLGRDGAPPGSKNPSPSVATISAIVKQSCSSTTSTSAGVLPAR